MKTDETRQGFIARFYEGRSRTMYITKIDLGEDSTYYIPEVDNYLGSLLIAFLNIKLDNYKSFLDFINTWGYAGFYGITDLTSKHWDRDQYEEFYRKIYENSRFEGNLEQAQADFIKTVNYCFNVDRTDNLKKFSPIDRFYLGLIKNKIGSLGNPLIAKYYNGTTINYDFIPDQVRGLENLTYLAQLNESELSAYVPSLNIQLVEEFATDNFLSICYLELMQLIQKNSSINRCSNCGTYFIPKVRSTEVYCNNCKDIGYENKVREDRHMSLYRNEYKARHAKLRKITNPVKKEEEKNNLSLWSKKALAKAKLKDLDEESFKQWLRDN